MFRRLPYCAVPGLAPICCDTNDPEMIECGLRKRLMRATPAIDRQMLEEFRRFVADFLQAHVGRATPMGFEEWLASTSYNEARKDELRREFCLLKGGKPSKRLSQKIKMFGKTEPYPDYKWVRLINSRSDAFKVWSGPLFKAIEKVVYELPEFVKHVPVPDRPALVLSLVKAGLSCYATDFESFEALFSPVVMDACECALYRHCLPWCSDVEYLCRTIMGTNKLSNRIGVTAELQGRRMSGDMCTSLGNGFTNLMLAKFLAARQGKQLTGLVEGDDGLFVTDAVLDKRDYARLGFLIKIAEVDCPTSASFCGMVFGPSGQIVRDPLEFCATFGWTSSFVGGGDRLMEQLLRAKALSSVYEMPHCPIVGAMARYALKQTRGVVPRFVNDGYHRAPPDEFDLPDFSPSSDTRELVARLYGIPSEVQVETERRIANGDFDFADIFAGRSASYLDYSSRFLEVG